MRHRDEGWGRRLATVGAAIWLLSCGSDPATGGRTVCQTEADCPSGVACQSGQCTESDVTPDAPVDLGGVDAAEEDILVPPDVVVDADTGPTLDPRVCLPCGNDVTCGDAGRCLPFRNARYCLADCSGGCAEGYTCGVTNDGQDACLPVTGWCGNCVDDDGDGFAVGSGCGPADCDDTNFNRFPGAAETCSGEDDDCDGRVDEGFVLLVDPLNCGTCGNSCNDATTTGQCVAGRCQPSGCQPGFVDCDGDFGSGCERPETSLNACGGCDDLGDSRAGDACGTCDEGALACGAAGTYVCEGDPGAGRRNVCNGCTTLDSTPGTACGFCALGALICDGTEALRCNEPDPTGFTVCGTTCCGPDDACAYETCVPDITCTSPSDCENDSYCDVSLGRCVPFGVGPIGGFDPECRREVVVARFSPRLQCKWTGPPGDDPFPAWTSVLATPMVADFNFNNDPGVVRPSIVFTSDDGVDGSTEDPTGLIRIIDGATCTQLYSLDMQFTSHSSPPAIGDLDGDGTPEIVAFRAGGGLVAFRYNREANTWGVWWTAQYPSGIPLTITGGGWGGPAIHDLDNDGVPEVLRGGVVVSNLGEVISDVRGNLAINTSAANHGAVFDVDGDGRVELVTGDLVLEWNPTTRTWDNETWFTASAGTTRGYTAIGEFGDFANTILPTAGAPEVVVIQTGAARLQTLEGRVVFGPIALPGAGTGGPPTIADFDGDGRAEFAAASRGAFTVFDLDCLPGGGTGTCASGRTDGILWSRTSQDFSSSQTGSSIFDFEGDGAAEAIYADECFTRVYDGTSGDVIFSAYRSSCTWQESPIVADVDGDFNSELVVPSNTNCNVTCSGLDPGNLDPQFPGLRCASDDECVSGACDAGFCRCTTDTECCLGSCEDFGFACAAPPAGTPGTGNTCRARHSPGLAGVIVYSDSLDRWINSRPIWNQLGYFVTHVTDSGGIPRTADVRNHWEIPALNSFRRNVQGDLQFDASPDLTVRRSGLPVTCDLSSTATLTVSVCNRGTEGVAAGSDVSFQRLDGGVALEVCRTALAANLAPGGCAQVSCDVGTLDTSPPGIDVQVVVDPDGTNVECVEDNNTAVLRGVYCTAVP